MRDPVKYARVTMCIGPRSRKASLRCTASNWEYFNRFDYQTVCPVLPLSRQMANTRLLAIDLSIDEKANV